jgi:hypothetical protein
VAKLLEKVETMRGEFAEKKIVDAWPLELNSHSGTLIVSEQLSRSQMVLI